MWDMREEERERRKCVGYEGGRERGESVWDMREEEREEKVFGIGGRKIETVAEREGGRNIETERRLVD